MRIIYWVIKNVNCVIVRGFDVCPAHSVTRFADQSTEVRSVGLRHRALLTPRGQIKTCRLYNGILLPTPDDASLTHPLRNLHRTQVPFRNISEQALVHIFFRNIPRRTLAHPGRNFYRTRAIVNNILEQAVTDIFFQEYF